MFFILHFNLVKFIKKCTWNIENMQTTFKTNAIWDELVKELDLKS
jgi:hypothetical protein